MEVLIQYHARPDGCDRRVLSGLTRRVIGETIRHCRGPERSEISVLYVNDDEILHLNEKYRDIARPTDVLTFPMGEGDPSPAPNTLLGDIVISLETAARQARGMRHSLRREIAHLLVHGTLHLLGFDHEDGPRPAAATERAKEMEESERACLASLQKKLIL